jgi:thiol-disulfide isomerase/thioredoxin
VPTRISVPEGQPFRLAGEIESGVPRIAFDPFFQSPTETFEHEAVFTLPVAVATDASAGAHPLTIRAAFQTCNQTTCLAPRSVEVEVVVTVASTAGPGTLGPGSEVPNFSFTDFAGKARTFSEYRGRYVLLDFWASWCRPCLADIPHLKELYGKYHDRGFDILGMDSETLGQEEADPEFARETADRARSIVATRGAVWTHATAETAVPVAEKVFRVESLPTKILVDPEGRVVARITEGAELDGTLARLFGAP